VADSFRLAEFYLCTPVAKSLDDEHSNIDTWLRLADSKRSTFLFPDKMEGPDLLFFLKEKTTRNKVLCVLQVN